MKPITPIRNNKSGLLRWTHQGVRYSITWGSCDDPTQRLKLELCGKMIYEDCLLDCLDETLVRYKKWLNGAPDLGSRQKVIKQSSLMTLLKERLDDNFNAADHSIMKLLEGYGKEVDGADEAKEFVKWIRRRGVASTSLKRYLNTLRSLRKDLFTEIKIKVEEKPKPAPFNRKEVDQILKVFQENEEFTPYYGFVLFLLNTGTRISEAIGIQWSNIDFEKREIHVFESLARGRNRSTRIRKSTKTCAYRAVPLNEKLFQYLIKSKQLHHKPGNELVFPSIKGKPLNDSNFAQRIFRSALKEAGVPYRPPSKCRATFASHCAENGLAPHVISSLLGHSRTSTTFEYYLGVVERPNLPEL